MFQLPSQHELGQYGVINFWPLDVMTHLAIAVLLGTLLLALRLFRQQRRTFLFYALTTTGLSLAAWLGRAVQGGYLNALLPLCGILAILFGLALAEAMDWTRQLDRGRRRVLESYVLLLALAQLLFLYYDPRAQFPGPQDEAAGVGVVETIASIPGEVFIPDHGYLAGMAGKTGSAYAGGLAELWGGFGGSETEAGANLRGELHQALTQQRYEAVILDEPSDWPGWFIADLDRYYVRQSPLIENPWVFWPVTARQVRPSVLYRAVRG